MTDLSSLRSHPFYQKLENFRPPVQEIVLEGCPVYFIRYDLSDQLVSGNKWYKLKGHLEAFISQDKYSKLLTFGGAYSNHLVAFAGICKAFGIQGIACIRGKELGSLPKHKQSNVLRLLKESGVQCEFVARSVYKNRNEESFQREPEKKFAAFVIPEGGTSHLSLVGVKQMAEFVPGACKQIALAIGSGGTAAGFLSKYSAKNIFAYSPMRDLGYSKNRIIELSEAEYHNNLSLISDYHFGGFGKTSKELTEFKAKFESRFEIPLDRVYSAKMCYGISDMLKSGRLPKEPLAIIHGGGLFAGHKKSTN